VKAKSKTGVQIDPNLTQALRAAGDEGTVEAVLMLKDANDAPAAKSQMDEWKQKIESLSKSESVETNFFPNLGSVAVRAKARVVKELLKQPGLSVASLNRF
jgi:hypothetical protein